MAQDGECIRQVFYMVKDNPSPDVVVLDIPPSRLNECCFELSVLADTSSSDEFKNDRNGFLFGFNKDLISSTVLKLEQFINGAWAEVATLNSNTYGTFYALNFFENSLNETFTGYQLNWKDVLTVLGEGDYRVKCIATFSVGGVSNFYSYSYCLKQYTPNRADKTVRLEWYMNGKFGNVDDKRPNDWGDLNWYNSYRLEGFFGFPSATYEDEYVQYQNGQRLYVVNEQEPEYTLLLKKLPQYIHDNIRMEVLQSDRLLISDYNSNNSAQYVQKEVQRTSAYEPQWHKMQSMFASVEVKFRQSYNNLKKLRC